jgi:glyoxylase-like metal-dependent hydrolase (beta-lactamase superfamily II)
LRNEAEPLVKRAAEGQIHQRITAIGTLDYPAYVVRGDERSLMIDSGVNHLAPRYLADIRRLFGEMGRPDYLFVTHSHYDHVGSAGYLKRHLPGLQLGGHERVAVLARKQSALDLMNRLSATHEELRQHNPAGEDVILQPFEVDIQLKGGDEVDLGGLKCRVYETPGHTRDSLSYFFPQIGAVFTGDAAGVLRQGPGFPLQVAFVASYQDYVQSLKLLIDLEPDIVCPAHYWVLSGDEAVKFLKRSLAETFRYRELIETYLDGASGDVDQAIQAMARAEYGSNGLALQPSAAQMTNLTAQVKHIAEIRGKKGV